MHNKIGALAAVVTLALGLAACGSSSSSTSSSGSPSATISGAGSTFAAPVYEQWGSSLQPHPTVNYQAVGSGAGITSLENKTVDFGASDPPLKPADFATLEKVGPVSQVPMFLGAITVSYNLPGVKSGMKLEGKTIADIYLGKIKTWNAPEIKALNPGVSLPSTSITVIHRSDSSGTTAGFTGYLAAVDPKWKTKVGEGKDVQWPTGTGAKGNAGVAGAVHRPRRRGRLRRAGVRAAAQLHVRLGQEQGRQLRRAEPRLDQRGRDRRDRAGEPRHQDQQPGGRGSLSARRPRRSSSSTRTCARRASRAAKARPRGSVAFLNYGLGSGQSCSARRPTPRCRRRSSKSPRRRSRRWNATGSRLAAERRHDDPWSPPGTGARRTGIGYRKTMEAATLAGVSARSSSAHRLRACPIARSSTASTALAGLILALIVYFFIRLVGEARPAFAKFGVLGFTFDNDWNVRPNSSARCRCWSARWSPR